VLRPSTAADYAQRLLAAQRYIEQHLDDELSPAEVAKVASFSLHHFHRLFRAQLGESVMQRVRRLRLERAARELRAHDDRLLDVALRAGFESHEAFTRAFEARFGVVPSVFRAQPSVRLSQWVHQPRAVSVSVEVRELDAVEFVFTRHRGSYQSVGDSWARLMRQLVAQGFSASVPLYGVCPDDPEVTPVEQLRFDAGAALGGVVPRGLERAVIPAGRWAVALHVGPYERLHETYLDLIGRWAPTSGEALAPEAVVEHYLNDPMVTSSAELKTEVRVLLA
jgi:AraC family transcriptional regulator